MPTVIPKVIPKVFRKAVLGQAEALMHGGFTLPGAIHTSGIYPSSRLSESFVGQCWTPDQGGVYQVAGSGYAQVRGAKLATTVAEGAILGPELVTNGGFDSDTWWTKNGTNTAITGGQAVVTNSDTSSNGVSRGTVITVGARYRITYTLVSISSGGFFPRIGSAGNGTNRTTPGTYTEDIVCAGDTNLRLYGTVTGQSFKIDNVSLREIIPVWLAPDTYPTRSVRTRLGTARVPTGTSVGMVSSPAFTNTVTCRKTNPTDTTNLTKSGDAASVLSVVDDVAALAAAGLSQICSTGKVYKLDNSAGVADAFTVISGGTGNTNYHFISVFARGSGVWRFGLESTVTQRATLTDIFTRYSFPEASPPSTSQKVTVGAKPGSIVYFILPELVESSYLPADPIVPLTPAADTLAAFTRAAVYAEHNTSGVFPTVSVVETLAIGHPDNPYATQATRMSDGSVVPVAAGASWAQNFAVFGTCVPDAVQSSTRIFNSYINADNYLLVTLEGTTGVSIYTRIGATSTGLGATYSHAANAPFDYIALKTIHGMAIRVRPHATMTWSAWATNVTASGKKPAPIGSKYQIGALNGAAGIAGTHPKVSIFELGNQESLAAYQDRAMLLAGRITG